METLRRDPLPNLPPCVSSEIERIEYDLEKLIIHIVDVKTSSEFEVVFDQSRGFRVLDEGDLLEFWPDCSQDQGYIFRIESGGWFDLESTRGGCFISGLGQPIPEYLVTGNNDCVSVLAYAPPIVRKKIAER